MYGLANEQQLTHWQNFPGVFNNSVLAIQQYKAYRTKKIHLLNQRSCTEQFKMNTYHFTPIVCRMHLNMRIKIYVSESFCICKSKRKYMWDYKMYVIEWIMACLAPHGDTWHAINLAIYTLSPHPVDVMSQPDNNVMMIKIILIKKANANGGHYHYS